MALPYFPPGISAAPQILEIHFIAERIHRLPEAAVLVSVKLAFAREVLHGLLLKCRHVVLDVVDHTGLQDEEAAVDPCAVANRFFAKAFDPCFGFGERESSEAPGRLDGRDGGEFSVVAVKLDG